MWPFKSPAEKARIAAGKAEWADFAEAAASGDPAAVRAGLTHLQDSSDAQALPAYERSERSRAAFRAYAEKALADGLNDEQLAVWGELFATFALEYRPHFIDLARRYMIVNAARRRPAVQAKSKLVTRAGEDVFFEVAAARMGQRPVEFQGIQFGTEDAVTDTGTLSITSERVVFIGDMRSFEFAHPQIVAATWYKDGIRFQVANAETLTFKIDEGWSEVVAALINWVHANPSRVAP